MLIDFTVSNFRSIRAAQTLSMLATNIKEHPENVMDSPDPEIKLLRTTVIYGANASGKSTILNAIQTFSNLISKSTDLKLKEDIPHYEPFKLDFEGAKLPTAFSIEFFGFDSIRYKYEVEFNIKEIISESLYHFPKSQSAKLFVRKKDLPIEYGESLSGPKKNVEKLLLPNQLFLSKAANNNNEQLGFIYSIITVGFFNLPQNADALINVTSTYINSGNFVGLAEELSRLLSNADTGIDNISVEKQLNSHDLFVKAFHKVYNNNIAIDSTAFDIRIESDGTRKLYGLLGYLLGIDWQESYEIGISLCIDELNNSFHPLLSEMIIKYFYNNKTNNQLIFTTHDTSLLKNDLFRRDQIWFTEKDKYGATHLYSLSEFDKDKVRPDIPFDKWYLSGRFGALPLIKNFDFTPYAETEKREHQES
jgi:AAA15 family ATPase/GTPase